MEDLSLGHFHSRTPSDTPTNHFGLQGGGDRIGCESEHTFQ